MKQEAAEPVEKKLANYMHSLGLGFSVCRMEAWLPVLYRAVAVITGKMVARCLIYRKPFNNPLLAYPTVPNITRFQKTTNGFNLNPEYLGPGITILDTSLGCGDLEIGFLCKLFLPHFPSYLPCFWTLSCLFSTQELVEYKSHPSLRRRGHT